MRSRRLNSSQIENIIDQDQELFLSIRPYVIMQQILGALPTGLHHLNGKGFAPNSIRARLLRFCQIIWCALILTIIVGATYKEWRGLEKKFDEVQTTLYSSQFLLYFCQQFYIFFATNFHGEKFQCTLHNIAQFDRRVATGHGIYPQYRLLSRFYFFHFLLIFVHFFCHVALLIAHKLYNFDEFSLNPLAFLLPNLLLEAYLIHYYWLLYVVKRRFIDLNQILERLLEKKGSYENSEMFILKRKILNIRELYGNIEMLTKQINENYSISIILMFIRSISVVGLNSFLIYQFVNHLRLVAALASAMMIATQFAKLFLILNSNEVLQQQKRHAILMLNDFKGPNREIEDIIVNFMQKMFMNRSSNIAAGLVELNLKHFTSILLTISTLVIFLIQYDVTYDVIHVNITNTTSDKS